MWPIVELHFVFGAHGRHLALILHPAPCTLGYFVAVAFFRVQNVRVCPWGLCGEGTSRRSWWRELAAVRSFRLGIARVVVQYVGPENLVISDNNRLISRVTLANSQVLLTAQACKFACCIQGRARGRRRRPLRLSKVSGRVGRHKIQWQRHARRPRGGAAKDAGAVCGARQAHPGFLVLEYH